jgi:hypothetical protein
VLIGLAARQPFADPMGVPPGYCVLARWR